MQKLKWLKCDRKTPSVFSRAAQVVCLTYAELTAFGNLDLVRVDEGGDGVKSVDNVQPEWSFIRLARRGCSGLYCGARLVTSDFAKLRSEFPARGKSFIILMQLDNFGNKIY